LAINRVGKKIGSSERQAIAFILKGQTSHTLVALTA
jgi:hypothetical protein